MKLKAPVTAITLFLSLWSFNHADVYAAPLPTLTVLGLDGGGNIDASGQCQTGSCFGMEVSPGFWIWTTLQPGYDGGFFVGFNQLSGGQEAAPSETNTTSGALTAAWFFFGAYGTFFADNTLNVFSDISNDGTTALNDFNVAWNGNAIPMGGGNFDDYSIAFDGAGGGNYSFSYRHVVPEGSFQGINFWMLARGSVTVTICDFCFFEADDISIIADSGEPAFWAPSYYDAAYQEGHTCSIELSPSNGLATVNQDCSGGTYTSGDGFEGLDSFDYTVTAPDGVSASATVNVTVVIGPDAGLCSTDYPLVEIATIGGGQRASVNQTLLTTFFGHIVTDTGLTTGGRNTVRICPGTTVDFSVLSTAGDATCVLNSAAAASTGTLAIGDKIICTNKPDGSDTDRFTIKSGQ